MGLKSIVTVRAWLIRYNPTLPGNKRLADAVCCKRIRAGWNEVSKPPVRMDNSGALRDFTSTLCSTPVTRVESSFLNGSTTLARSRTVQREVLLNDRFFEKNGSILVSIRSAIRLVCVPS